MLSPKYLYYIRECDALPLGLTKCILPINRSLSPFAHSGRSQTVGFNSTQERCSQRWTQSWSGVLPWEELFKEKMEQKLLALCSTLYTRLLHQSLRTSAFFNSTNVCLFHFHLFAMKYHLIYIGKSRNRRTFSKIENLRFLQNYDDYNCIFGIKLKGLSLSFIWRVMQWN